METLIIQQLPRYTTERYYILSEIEQISDFIFMNDLKKETHIVKSKQVGVVYVLWDLSVHLSIVSDKINNILANYVRVFPNIKYSLICIEAIIPTHNTIEQYNDEIRCLLCLTKTTIA